MAEDVPAVRLPGLRGYDGHQNDVIFCGDDAQRHVIFFPGDVQNYVEIMEEHKENKAWSEWDLESTATLLHKQFHKSFIWVVRPVLLHLNTFACYNNFVQTDLYGIPDHRNSDSMALKHLQELLKSAVGKILGIVDEEDDVTSEFPITIVGFSKGCVVLNQIAHELASMSLADDDNVQEFVRRIDSMHWLDGGHNGQSNTWLTDDESLFALTEHIPKIRVHVTPYQVRNKDFPWKRKEEESFVKKLQILGCDIREKLHFEDRLPSLADHFSIIREFKKIPEIKNKRNLSPC